MNASKVEKGSKLVITINDDGTISTNATQAFGEEADILADLQALAVEVGGALTVEKHVENHHHHHHGHTGHTHRHGH